MKTLICELDNALSKTTFSTEVSAHNLRVTLSDQFSAISGHKHLADDSQSPTSKSFRLPLNDAVEHLISLKKAAGYQIIILSKASSKLLNSLRKSHPVFDEVVFDKNIPIDCREFEYVGTAKTDIETWRNAHKCYVVERASEVTTHLKTSGIDIEKSFKSVQLEPANALAALRPTQWLKNFLVFVPLITSQQLTDFVSLSNSVLMFIGFSLVASFGYVVNDLLDIQSDRAHVTKKYRPFASGDLSAHQGIAIGLTALLSAVAVSLSLPLSASLTLFCYLLLTVVYSAYLKTKIMMDVVALGALFTLRVMGGAEAIQSELSFYLLSFSIFLFASLGMIKRYAELLNLEKREKLNVKGRGYQVEDMAPVRIIGISMGYMSVFILGQYINSPVVTQYYNNPKFIWLLFPLLMFWLGRLWILANRGEVNEDPLIFTVKDRTSQLVFATAAVILFLAD